MFLLNTRTSGKTPGNLEAMEPRLAVAGAMALTADGLLLSAADVAGAAQRNDAFLYESNLQSLFSQDKALPSASAAYSWVVPNQDRSTPQAPAKPRPTGASSQNKPTTTPSSVSESSPSLNTPSDTTQQPSENSTSVGLWADLSQSSRGLDGSVAIGSIKGTDVSALPNTPASGKNASAPLFTGNSSGSKSAPASASRSGGPSALAAQTTEPGGTANNQTTPTVSATFGEMGITTLTYNGQQLASAASLSDPGVFRLFQWYEQRPGQSAPVNVWADNQPLPQRSYNPQTQTVSLTYPWGVVEGRFTTLPDRLLLNVTVRNTSPDVTITGFNLYPTLIDFPQDPNIAGVLIANSQQQPVVVRADYTSAALTITNEAIDKTKTVYGGFRTLTGNGTNLDKRYVVLGTTTWGDRGPVNTSRPVAPGQAEVFDMALRFGPGGASTGNDDLDGGFTDAFPMELHWPDRRMIGVSFPATTSTEYNWPTNPNGFLRTGSINVFTDAGRQQLRSGLVQEVQGSIERMHRDGGQGIIFWNLEGNRYGGAPWFAGFLGAPNMIESIAPELSYAPNGEKTVDLLFRMVREAGLRTGMTLRPEVLVPFQGGYQQQLPTTDDEIYQTLLTKVRYAQDRWGASIFYIDVIDAKYVDVIQRLQASLPDVLLIPEHESQRTYAYSAPWQSPERPTEWATPAEVRSVYPNAFSAIGAFKAPVDQASENLLLQSVNAGDILLVHSWWDNPSTLQAERAYARANPVGIAGKTTLAQGTTYGLNFFTIHKNVNEVVRWEINWGDGSPVQTVFGMPRVANHTYDAPLGTYTISARAFFTDGTSFQPAPISLNINKAGAVITPIPDQTATAGQVLNLPAFTFTDPDNTGVYNVKIEWGDGTFDSLGYFPTGNGVYTTFPAQKVFAGNGDRLVKVSVIDSSGAIGKLNVNVRVNMPNRGNGIGLQGFYTDSTGEYVAQIDPNISMSFTDYSSTPIGKMSDFTVTWTGTILAQLSETYTFTTQAKDGLILTINGQKIIDRWTFHGPSQSGSINLVAGQTYDIRLDYRTGSTPNGFVFLYWQSPSTPRELVPKRQLNPTFGIPTPPPPIQELPPIQIASTDLFASPGGSKIQLPPPPTKK